MEMYALTLNSWVCIFHVHSVKLIGLYTLGPCSKHLYTCIQVQTLFTTLIIVCKLSSLLFAPSLFKGTF